VKTKMKIDAEDRCGWGRPPRDEQERVAATRSPRRDQHGEQEESVDGRSFVTKKRIICRPATTKCKEKIREKRETLISDSVYYAMNNTCIHLRVVGIYKETLNKYNNRNADIYLIEMSWYSVCCFGVLE
jgi:hypothetical protein